MMLGSTLASLLLLFTLFSASSSLLWDSNGYILYCPCMGRFGNQAAHFLGALQFAKDLNRTLTLPPFRTYVRPRNVPFKEWFKPEVVAEYHRALPLEDFLDSFGDSHWPSNDRVGYCYRSISSSINDCQMKEGNPFGPFWDELGVSFNRSVFTHLSYGTSQESLLNQWKERFPPSSHPILAFKGAPASFPVSKRNRHLQKYLVWNEAIMEEAKDYWTNTMNSRKFIAVHLRIGSDWKRACEHAVGQRSYMESLMCLEDLPPDRHVTEDICYPSTERIIADIRQTVSRTGINTVYIGSDSPPPIEEIKNGLETEIALYHMNPPGPQLDLIMFELADHFIANCVSSLSAFAVRARNIREIPTSFLGLISNGLHEEL